MVVLLRLLALEILGMGLFCLHPKDMELVLHRRYGLLGLNGCGKSTLLTAIGCRKIPIPDHMDIYHLSREAEALEAEDGGGGEALDRVYERLESLDVATAEKRAAEILFGLGFDKHTQAKTTRDFSGGWKMRIALARALFMKPTILLLDEPTNHLGNAELKGTILQLLHTPLLFLTLMMMMMMMMMMQRPLEKVRFLFYFNGESVVWPLG